MITKSQDFNQLLKNLILREEEFMKKVLSIFNNDGWGLITYFNQNSFNTFFSNSDYRKIISNFIVYQEGIGMYLMLKYLGFNETKRIDSTEVNKKGIDKIIEMKKEVCFIGGNFDPKEIRQKLVKKGLNLEFYHHGYFNLNEIDEVVEKLKMTKSRFILLGMGTPKQEIVAIKISEKIPNKIFICIGNFMNYFLGYEERAPLLLRKLQLEWFYRLIKQPKKFFKRYIIGIPLFFIRGLFLLKPERNKLK